MKRILVLIFLMCATAVGTMAQTENKAALAKQRADRLSDQMIRELKLNNFQANRLREINRNKINKIMQIEQKYANNPALADKNCEGVCRERDKELESFLSFDQYSRYYSNRSDYYDSDKDFATKIGLIKPGKNTSENGISSKHSAEKTISDPVLRPSVNR